MSAKDIAKHICNYQLDTVYIVERYDSVSKWSVLPSVYFTSKMDALSRIYDLVEKVERKTGKVPYGFRIACLKQYSPQTNVCSTQYSE